MAVTPDDLRGVLGILDLPAPAMEDAADRVEREALNARRAAAAVRLHGVATGEIQRYAPGAPDAHKDEALLRIAGYLHTDDPGVRALRVMKTADLEIEPRTVGSALRLSGAMALLAPYRTRRAS